MKTKTGEWKWSMQGQGRNALGKRYRGKHKEVSSQEIIEALTKKSNIVWKRAPKAPK